MNIDMMGLRTVDLTRTANVMIVEDHELVRDGLKQLIGSQDNLSICGEASSVQDAKSKFQEWSPNVVIIDLSLQDGSGLELIKWIHHRSPETKLVVSTMRDERDYGERAFRAGAVGYVNKQEPARMVVTAIHRVLDDKLHFSDELVGRLMRRAMGKNRPEDSAVSTLSDREAEILLLIGQGLDTESIAKHLHLSPNTVGTYRERLKTKLKLKNAAELTRYAIIWVEENNG